MYENPLIGEKLKLVIFLLKDKYSELEISEACGYKKIDQFYKEVKSFNFQNQENEISTQFDLFEKSKKIIEDKSFNENFEINFKNIAIDKFFIKNSKYHLNNLNIFKKCLCVVDGEHHGTVFIPSRLVNKSEIWDYSKAKLKDWNLKSLLNDKSLHTYQNEEAANEYLGFHAFVEPMKYLQVEQYWYIDENLEPEKWFDYGEIAEFHGIRFQDCDHQSSWRDG